MFINGVEIPYLITNAVEITQQEYDLLQDKSGTYIITDAPSVPLSGSEVSFSSTGTSISAATVQAALAALSVVNSFNIATTDWVANSDVSTSTEYPYIASVSSTLYTNNSVPNWELFGASGIPSATEKEAIDLVQYANFTSSGITLYATDQPGAALVLKVKGL